MKLVIEIDLGNDAMQSASDVQVAIQGALDHKRLLVEAFLEGDGGTLRDANGNTVGAWRCLSEVVDPAVDWEADFDAYEAARIYRGSFPLSWLGPGEQVRAASDRSGACEVIHADGLIRRVNIGDRVMHSRDGS